MSMFSRFFCVEGRRLFWGKCTDGNFLVILMENDFLLNWIILSLQKILFLRLYNYGAKLDTIFKKS